MASNVFVFVQFEFPWALGPADGRYLLRAAHDGEPERVVVLGTLGSRVGAPERPPRGVRARWRERPRPASADPAPVTTTRATVIDPVPLAAASQARAWLEQLDREREIGTAATYMNRVVHLHRIAAADAYARELSPAQALVIRAGWGEGEQVADGDWEHALELPWRAPRRGPRRDRSAALRPQERLAALLGRRSADLVCEELALRARLDLDQGRLAHSALQLDLAYEAALRELPAEGRQDLVVRIAELQQLHAQVAGQARIALAAGAGSPQAPDAPVPDADVLEHALVRLESALRARTATGFTR